MSFADWKKRSKRYQRMMGCSYIQFDDAEEVTLAAYKAGERKGRKDAEEIAKKKNGDSFEPETKCVHATHDAPGYIGEAS
jgi:hypothetical protein